jgi:alpha-glucosidase
MRSPRQLAFVLVLAFALPHVSFAQLGAVKAVEPAKNGISLQSGTITVQLNAISPTAFRVRYSTSGKFSQNTSFAVVGNTSANVAVERHVNPGQITLSTGQLTVSIDQRTGAIAFLDPAGNLISGDAKGFPVEFHGPSFKVYKSMPIDEHYFGMGEKAAALDHRGYAFTMWNTDAYGWVDGTDPLYKSIPFFIGLRKGRAYGIYLDNTYRSSFEFAKESNDYYSFGAPGGELDYYFFYGPDPKSVVTQYTALTGRTPLPPRWALGYQQSRYSYYPESRVYEVAKELREHKIPSDVLYLDIDYLENHAAFDINRHYFPNFEKMVSDLAKDNFKLVVISDLHLSAKQGYKPYDEGIAGDDFVKNPNGSVYVGPVWPGPSVFPDFTLKRVRDWYGSLYKDFVQMGVGGIWNDMNEPAVFVYPAKTMPLDTVHRVDEPGGERKTDHREIHNVFGLENTRATYDGLLKLAPNARPFVLTRAGFAGSQRYAATWTGDNQATWEHYKLTLPTLLSLGVSGYAFAGNDVGGFAQSPQPDLLTRWFEVGAFEPMFRDHNDAETMPKEPWVHGPVHEAIRRRYIEERYRLMPYLYTAFEESSRNGLPIMRPVFLEFPTFGDPHDANGDWVGKDTEFFFGHDLLIAPQLAETLNPLEVFIPEGDWYNYWTGEKLDHVKRFRIHPALGDLPVYVRAGAIIPEQPLVQNAAEVPNGPLELRVYPGPDCKGSLYWDDGETFNYKKGEFYRQAFTCSVNGNAVTVNLGAVEGSFQPWWKSVKIIVYGHRAAKNVTQNGAAVQAQFANNAETFEVPASRTEIKIELTY